jgi:hypothetical protein
LKQTLDLPLAETRSCGVEKMRKLIASKNSGAEKSISPRQEKYADNFPPQE